MFIRGTHALKAYQGRSPDEPEEMIHVGAKEMRLQKVTAAKLKKIRNSVLRQSVLIL